MSRKIVALVLVAILLFPVAAVLGVIYVAGLLVVVGVLSSGWFVYSRLMGRNEYEGSDWEDILENEYTESQEKESREEAFKTTHEKASEFHDDDL